MKHVRQKPVKHDDYLTSKWYYFMQRETHNIYENFCTLMSHNLSLFHTSFWQKLYPFSLFVNGKDLIGWDIKLNFFWLDSFLKHYKEYVDYVLQNCMNITSIVTNANFDICFNYSSMLLLNKSLGSHLGYYNVLYKSYRQTKTTPDEDPECNGPKAKKKKKSWLEANRLCNATGGTLPILRDRSELEDLMALSRLSPQAPLNEAFFIGVNHQVRG